MKISRVLALVLSFALLSFSFASCNVSENNKPTEKPTEASTSVPTGAPTEAPTATPTEKPTEAPTEEPTEAPTSAPTEKPTEKPTEEPTEEPTEDPDMNTEKPTDNPTPVISLNIGSYNIANGRNVNHDLTVIGNDIKEKNLDIVGLQEVDQFVNRSGKQNTVKILSESSGLEYYAFFKAINHDGGEYGIGILSRYPIKSEKTVKLYSKDAEQRVLGCAVIELPDRDINFFVTHMSYESTFLWDKQFYEIADILKDCDDYILTGDFNTEDFTSFYNELDEVELVNTDYLKVPTFEDGTSIDNIIYSSKYWSFGDPQALINQHSDHNLLYATATWN